VLNKMKGYNMITYITGNIFNSSDDVLIHGCNCFKTMGAGVAFQVKRLYPGAATADINNPTPKLGEYSSWTGKNRIHNKQITIVNAYTQYNPYPPVDYDAIKKVMNQISIDFKGKTICMPKIGAGLAGGDWQKISGIIDGIFHDIPINVYILG